jgi:ABC-type branched-subunit amino acid transport system ATPase component
MDFPELTVELKNYRCFSDACPASFQVGGGGITAFVGRNNAGKSALLRFFFDFRGAFQSFGFLDSVNWSGCTVPNSVSDSAELFHDGNHRNLEVMLKWMVESKDVTGGDHQSLLVELRRQDFAAQTKKFNSLTVATLESLRSHEGRCADAASGRQVFDFANMSALIRALLDTCYLPSARLAMNTQGGPQGDMVIGDEFVAKWSELRFGKQQSARRRLQSVEADVARLLRLKSFSTREMSGRHDLIFEVNGRELPHGDVGSGISQLLLLLGSVAMKRPSLILVDEPELNLHPALQADLVTTLAGYSGGNLAFATHNIGLARAVASRIYVVRENEAEHRSEVVELDNDPSLAQVLGELQFGSYSTLGGTRVLLVEGREDIKVFQQWLHLLGVSQDVVLLPLGGSSTIHGKSLEHLSQVQRMSTQVAAIIDSERSAEGAELSAARREFQSVCDALHIQCHVTLKRATENYFPQSAIDRSKLNHVALGPFDRPSSSTNWSKSRNWLIAKKMTLSELDSTDVGQFLRSWLATPKS